MIDRVNRAFLLGLGTVAFTKEKAEQIIDELVKLGHLEKGEAPKIINDLVEKGQQFREDLSAAVKREVAQLRLDLGLVTRRELAQLEDSINEVNERLKRLEERLQARE